MSVRDVAVLVKLKRNIQQSVHQFGERCGRVGETEVKYPTNLSTMSMRDVAVLVRLKSIKYNNLSIMSLRDMAVLMRLLFQQSVHHVGERYDSFVETEQY